MMDEEAALAALTQSLEYWQGHDDVVLVETLLSCVEAYSHARRALKEELIKPKYQADNLDLVVPKLFEQLGLGTRLRNVLHKHCERVAKSGTELPNTSHPNAGLSSSPSISGTVSRESTNPSTSGVAGSGVCGGIGNARNANGIKIMGEESGLRVITDARARWQRRVIERLTLLASEAKQPFAGTYNSDEVCRTKSQPAGSQPAVANAQKSHEGSQRDVRVCSVRRAFTYSASDLFEAVVNIPATAPANKPHSQGLAAAPPTVAPQWGLMNLTLKAPSIDWLRKFFSELHTKNRQIGLDDRVHKWFGQERQVAGMAAAELGSILECRQLARTGVPAGARPRVWANALGLAAITEKHRKISKLENSLKATLLSQHFSNVRHYHDLLDDVDARSLFTDTLIRADVACVTDDASFFVFEDRLEEIMLAFTRDKEVSSSCSVPPHPYLLGRGQHGLDHGTYPPSGVLPFRGLVSFAAPLGYLYTNQEEMYHVFRSLYTRHFCRLHTIAVTALPTLSLPNLCATFEGVLQEVEPDVAFHMQDLGIPPLQIAFPWLVHAFVGYLETEEVLLLWDRVIGFDSLLPLPLLAAAIFSFRRKALLAARSLEGCLEVMEHLSQIHVVPLLQHSLFTL